LEDISIEKLKSNQSSCVIDTPMRPIEIQNVSSFAPSPEIEKETKVSSFMGQVTPAKQGIKISPSITATSFLKSNSLPSQEEVPKQNLVLNKDQAEKLKQILSAIPLLKYQ